MSESEQVVSDLSVNFRQIESTNDEDYLTRLPDSIISCILSRLCIKDAVRTSVLSKEWEKKWMLIESFKIHCGESSGNFANFVERVLLHAKYIRCFQLKTYCKFGMSRVVSCISAALRHKIEILDVEYRWVREESEMDEHYNLCLLNNSSLRKLYIRVHFPAVCIHFPAVICLPNLTSLYLLNVCLLNENSSINHLTYTFPVLKTLRLENCNWLRVKLVEIHAPELTAFDFSDNAYSAPITHDDVEDYSIKLIGANKLQKFASSCRLQNEAIMIGSQVVKASFTYEILAAVYDDVDKLPKSKGLEVLSIIKELSSLKELKLTNYMIECMRYWRQQFSLLRLGKLVKLNLELPISSEGLLGLLHAAPYLKFLYIEVIGKDIWNYDVDDDYEEVETVPSCVVSHLEEIFFKYHDMHTEGNGVARFFIKNGKNLKKLHLSVPHWNDDILEELSTVPKASTSLTIHKQKPGSRGAFYSS